MSDEELINFSRSIRPYPVERNATGELEILTACGLNAAHMQTYVLCELAKWEEKHGGVTFSSQCGFTWTDTSVRMASASWISERRWNTFREKGERGFVDGSPDFLIEFLRDPDLRGESKARMEMWISNGAQLAWMVDPFAATVSVYRPGAAAEVLMHPKQAEADTVVPGFRLETARMWDK